MHGVFTKPWCHPIIEALPTPEIIASLCVKQSQAQEEPLLQAGVWAKDNTALGMLDSLEDAQTASLLWLTASRRVCSANLTLMKLIHIVCGYASSTRHLVHWHKNQSLATMEEAYAWTSVTVVSSD